MSRIKNSPRARRRAFVRQCIHLGSNVKAVSLEYFTKNHASTQFDKRLTREKFNNSWSTRGLGAHSQSDISHGGEK